MPACQRLRPARQSPEASRWRTGAADGGQAPGLLQHVMARGIEGKEIFKDDKDRESFLDRLANILDETQTQCYAWALIPNPARLARPPRLLSWRAGLSEQF